MTARLDVNAKDGFPLTLSRYRDLARLSLEPRVWNFLAGGAGDERTLRANERAFQQRPLRPRVLRGADTIELKTDLLGVSYPSPILVAPIGCQELFHTDGELATACGAAEAGSVMVLSTMSTRPLESVAAASRSPHWFQLYLLKDRDRTLSLVRRAEDAGYTALVITVDVPRAGVRERDLLGGFRFPDWLRFANLEDETKAGAEASTQRGIGVMGVTKSLFDASATWDTIEWIASKTRLPIVLKGILTAEDTELAVAHGVRGIVVSNHGGRQLDGCPSSLDALAEVVAAAGPHCDVFLDGGVRRGADVLRARALGARGVLVGRPVMWGLAVDGRRGVAAVLKLLHRELEDAMALCGQRSWAEVDTSLVRSSPNEAAGSVGA